MKLNRFRVGELITVIDEKNTEGFDYPFYGININKEFMPSVANTSNVDKKKYKVIKNNRFVFSGMQTGRDQCIRIGIYRGSFNVLVSPAYTTFEVTNPAILPLYFFMVFNSKEMDRYGAFLSDSSVRSNLDWDRFCEIELEIPPLEIQKKYVAIYEGLLTNLRTYEKGLDDLKLVCDGYIEQLRRRIGSQKIGPYIEQVDERNSNLSVKLAMGVDNKKTFVPPKQVAKTERSAKVVRNGWFAYNRATTRNGEKISIAYRDGPDCVVSSAYGVFKIVDETLLNPKYLMAWFKRTEFDRYARYMSKGSAHEFFEFSDMQEVSIPIPGINTQRSIVSIYESIERRQGILNKIKKTVASLCPILIRGSLQEASGL